ncbi:MULTISPECIES: type VI secretion system tube protein Hcp [unclassified Pseudomonas]|uniref:Hcp family type VI secretion system effector n=1 Tax=unclassified Pseudomonas TaxID=196821 RepID=UPI000D36B3C8|nr:MULTISPECIES: type VI secretion system tube protein Hcp [unclassified Pseudomonas]RAU45850.1 Hcp1 family type VI secretion system effector [Pseudomonas sp. RIT 409]RAU56051.1 Hcp1 family type VI secretion system effector [Pseudomonas sp. RIT 412]
MAFDGFIKLDGIAGESMDDRHKGWIEITGYNFGVNQSTSATASSNGGAGSGRATLTDFSFSKRLDTSSARLFEASCSGEHIKELTLVLYRAGGDKLKYYEVRLEEVIISDFSQEGESGEPMERVQINFGRIHVVYTQQKRSDGAAAGNISGGWDRIANKRFS